MTIHDRTRLTDLLLILKKIGSTYLFSLELNYKYYNFISFDIDILLKINIYEIMLLYLSLILNKKWRKKKKKKKAV